MIFAQLWPDKVVIAGHAGYAPKGQDIVCSAVSALFLTFAESLEALDPECVLEEISDKTGSMLTWQRPMNSAGVVLLTAFKIGLSAIAQDYPENLTIQDFKPLH